MAAPKDNKFAEKPEAEKMAGKGRLVVDLGDLKSRVVRAAQGRKVVDWIQEVLADACKRAGF